MGPFVAGRAPWARFSGELAAFLMALVSVSSSLAAERPDWVPAIKRFVRHPDNIVLEPSLPAEGHMIMPGCVVKNEDDRTYYLFYHCSDGKSTSINVATSHDLIHWRSHPGNPVIACRRGKIEASDPSIVVLEKGYYLLYREEPPAKFLAAWSTDFTHWNLIGEVFSIGPAGAWDSVRMDMPYLFREADRWLLFYGAKGPDGKRRIGVARPEWEHRAFPKAPSARETRTS
jgi:predicted GH43/DUF377 family glycosyl hydrolase